jgi:small subunit ribosomal protein S20
MAHHKSAKKRIRRNGRRQEINIARRSRVRTHLRKVEEAISVGDQEAARAALRAAEPEIMRGVHAGIVKKNTGSRRVSRLSARVKAMGS